MRKVSAIAYATFLESFRRKDPYILIILTFLLVLGAGLFSRFGAEGLGKFVKDIGFSASNALAIIICVVTAARQLPVEIQNRTLYPLLAKPVARAQVLLGKYLGVAVLSSIVVIVFYVELYVLFRFLGISVGSVFFQAMYLRVLSMWFVAAMVIFFSLVMTQSANVTISTLLCIAMSTFSNALLTVMTELQGISLRAFQMLYWVLPHMELFDLSKKEVHDWPGVPFWVLLCMTLYAAIYCAVFLGLGCRRFARLQL